MSGRNISRGLTQDGLVVGRRGMTIGLIFSRLLVVRLGQGRAVDRFDSPQVGRLLLSIDVIHSCFWKIRDLE